MSGIVSSPAFIGRQVELARILTALETAATGEGRLILIAGEAGVGKTRLTQEAVHRVRAEGGKAAVGRCYEMSGAGIPFGPIRTALQYLAAGQADLEPLLSNFEAGAERDRIGLGAESNQARVFEACIDFVRTVGATAPLLIVAEDIHWADPSTLDLLRFLAQAITDVPVAIAATFRSDELHRRHPLQPFLGEIQRARTTERIDLQRFSASEVAEQVEAILGKPGPPEVVDRIHSRSDGNAFYAEELVAVENSGDPLPTQMRDVLLARVGTLSEPAQQMLALASAGGTRTPTAILAAVADSDSSQIEHLVREGVDRHLLVTADADGEEYLAFRHALVQEAVYGDLLPGERSRLHGRYAAALERAHDPEGELSGELAYHWFAAHDLPRALSASVAAAKWAESNHGYADAQKHYERALELWDRVPGASDRTGIDLIDLLERTARMAAVTSPLRASALMADAIRSAEGTTPTRAGLLKEQYGRYAWMAGDGLTALQACRQAVDMVPKQPLTTARARVLASLGQILMITLHPDEGRAICQEAVDAARQVGAPDIECHALNSLGMTNVYLGNLDLGLAQLRESLDVAIRIGAIDDVERAHGNLVDALSHSGRLAEAAAAATIAFDYADEHGLGRVMGVIDLAEGGLALYRLGRWHDAYQMLRKAWRMVPTGVPQITVEERLALLDVGTGRHQSAAGLIATAHPLIDRAVEAQLVAPLAEAAAEMSLWQNRPVDARAELAAAFERLPAQPGYISRLGPLLALAVRAEADIAEMARVRSDEGAAAEALEIASKRVATMATLHQQAELSLPNFLSQAQAWLAACRAELTRLNGTSDPAAWANCATRFAEIPMAYPHGYALWREVEAQLAVRRNRSGATELLGEALRMAEELGAEPLAGEIRALAVRAGIALETQSASDAPPSPTDSLGLTPREREILKLIATGKSNRQIAATLYITEGTAGTHVSNILGKLGVRARTEAASIAYKVGLVD